MDLEEKRRGEDLIFVAKDRVLWRAFTTTRTTTELRIC
jgi:hypothetical protein